jgi:tetratricopeptide (TPR) repeat protein
MGEMNKGGLARPILIWVALVTLNLVVYDGVNRFELVNWDDATYITENPTVLSGLSWSTAWWALTTGHSPYWHPMTWLSHLLDVSLFGPDAGAYHVISLLLHIANSILVFELLRRMTRDLWRSAFVAAVFAVHPLHVESVAWIAERKDVLSTLFWLLTSLAYLRYVKRPEGMRYAAVATLFALALMSKPMAVTLPVILLLLDVWPLQRMSRRAVLEKIPLLALALATSVATVVIQHRVGAMAGLDALPWQIRVGNATIGYVAYLWKTVWPSHLAPFYPLFQLSAGRIAGAALVMAALTGAAVAVRRQYPCAFVGWFWYLISIAPVIGLFQAGEQGMADRFMYVPMIGLLIAVAWLAPRRMWPAAGPIILACTIVARAQAAHWENSIELWSHAIRVTPESYMAHENLGQALRERGQFDAAIASYQRALALAPSHTPAYAAVIHNSIGMVFTRQGRTGEAEQSFAAAVQANGNLAEARLNLANALSAEGRSTEAVSHFERAIALRPDYVEPRVGLGAALLRQGRAAEAMPHYREALKLDPNLAEAHNGLGGALATLGQDTDAMTEYREALRLKPDLQTAHLNVAILLIKKGDVAQARRHLEMALSIDPNYAPARQALQAVGGLR